jgi:molecular chaperone IbpA
LNLELEPPIYAYEGRQFGIFDNRKLMNAATQTGHSTLYRSEGGYTMRTFDLSPLFRSTVGFDRMSRLLDAAMEQDAGTQSYPPYNIEKLDENDYRITMAVAGFSADDLEMTQTGGSLVITGRKESKVEEDRFLHRGIATRSFERRFQLADHIQIVNARLDNGLLHIDLHREVPEEKRPRTIRIENAVNNQTIESGAGRPALASEQNQGAGQAA